ncbi:LOW QUALITY PROTEIN: uncharacterized protein ACR2FA_009915, partial [Aphomia sociella]
CRSCFFNSGVSGNTVVENTVVVGNNAGAGGVGLTNSGTLGSNVGLTNAGLLGTGVAGAGWANTGLSGSGIALGNTGLVGSAVVPAMSTDYLSLASLWRRTFTINSYSPIVPSGLTVVSENAIEGPVVVVGQLPFLSAVAFEGSLDTDGTSAAGCGCGNSGNVGITSESYTPLVAPTIGGLGLGAGLGVGAGRGLGAGLRIG